MTIDDLADHFEAAVKETTFTLNLLEQCKVRSMSGGQGVDMGHKAWGLGMTWSHAQALTFCTTG